MANEVRLRSGNTYTRTVRMDAAPVKLDRKDPIGAACLGKVVRDVAAGNFDNMGNISVIAGTFSAAESSNGPVKIGQEEVTIMFDPKAKTRHELSNPAMVKNYLDAGFRIEKTKVVDLMSST